MCIIQILPFSVDEKVVKFRHIFLMLGSMALLCCSDIQCVTAPCPCTNNPFLCRISRLLQSKMSVHTHVTEILEHWIIR